MRKAKRTAMELGTHASLVRCDAMHITTDAAKRINKRADECMWASGRGADPLQLMGQPVCLKRTRSVCLVNRVTFLLQAKNS